MKRGSGTRARESRRHRAARIGRTGQVLAFLAVLIHLTASAAHAGRLALLSADLPDTELSPAASLARSLSVLCTAAGIRIAPRADLEDFDVEKEEPAPPLGCALCVYAGAHVLSAALDAATACGPTDAYGQTFGFTALSVAVKPFHTVPPPARAPPVPLV